MCLIVTLDKQILHTQQQIGTTYLDKTIIF